MHDHELHRIRSLEDMALLADEWDRLAARCSGHLASQTHQWATNAWHAVARPRGRDLEILTLRAEGRLVALWPLVSYRVSGVCIVRPLGSEATEYCAPLVEQATHHERWTGALWETAAAISDFVLLPHLDLASVLTAIARRESKACFADPTVRAPYVDRRDYEDWSGYAATVSTSHRRGLRYKRRRMAKLGEITFEQEAPGVASGMIDWLLDHKRRWMVRRGLRNDWLGRADYQDFLRRAVSCEDPMGSLSLFVLRVGGIPVAAQLNSVDGRRMEYLVGAHDAAFAAYSPGEILTEECLRWAFAQDLDYDFRIGDEAYKFAWARRWRDTATLHVATGLRGLPIIAALRASDMVKRARFRLGLGRFLPAALRSHQRAGARPDPQSVNL